MGRTLNMCKMEKSSEKSQKTGRNKRKLDNERKMGTTSDLQKVLKCALKTISSISDSEDKAEEETKPKPVIPIKR